VYHTPSPWLTMCIMVSARKQLKIAKQTRNAARLTAVATVVGVRDQRRMAREQAVAKPGWYVDPFDHRFMIWWDGGQYVPESKRWA
jgi:hypothetical protein